MATASPTACLASSAIRCRDVETGPNLGVLAVFPSNGATCRCPPSLHGVSWAQFPRFGGTMRHSDSSPPIPPRFVAFARRYHPSTCGSLRRTPGATSTASGGTNMATAAIANRLARMVWRVWRDDRPVVAETREAA